MKFDAGDYQEFFADLREEGYHILNRTLARRNGYPNRFPDYPQVDPAGLTEGTRITIRAFIAMDTTPTPRVQSGQIDLEVEFVDPETHKLFANILTELPASFPLARGTTIELDLDEVIAVHENLHHR